MGLLRVSSLRFMLAVKGLGFRVSVCVGLKCRGIGAQGLGFKGDIWRLHASRRFKAVHAKHAPSPCRRSIPEPLTLRP